MTVYVNDKPVMVFRGARARNALIKYYKQLGQRIAVENLLITDRWGNTLSDDSPLMENEKIYAK